MSYAPEPPRSAAWASPTAAPPTETRKVASVESMSLKPLPWLAEPVVERDAHVLEHDVAEHVRAR